MPYRQQTSTFDPATRERVTATLQDRLVALIDAGLTFKHIHWNVAGPGFMAAHEFLDDQTADLRAMADETAERIATVGGTPKGLAGVVARSRKTLDYEVMQGSVAEHFTALAELLELMISDHRWSIGEMEQDDIVTADLLTNHTGRLELMLWFVRSHLDPSVTELETTADEPELIGLGSSS